MEHERREYDVDLSRRMDTQDKLLREIRDMIVGHIGEHKQRAFVEQSTKKALDEIVLLWRASKIIIPALVASAAVILSAWAWAKEHIR